MQQEVQEKYHKEDVDELYAKGYEICSYYNIICGKQKF